MIYSSILLRWILELFPGLAIMTIRVTLFSGHRFSVLLGVNSGVRYLF